MTDERRAELQHRLQRIRDKHGHGYFARRLRTPENLARLCFNSMRVEGILSNYDRLLASAKELLEDD